MVGGDIDESYLCDSPGVYVLNTTSLSWSDGFTPGNEYAIPALLFNVTGGEGRSNSTGGSGWQGPNEASRLLQAYSSKLKRIGAMYGNSYSSRKSHLADH